MTPEEIVQQMRDNVYCRIGRSIISGVGVIAIKRIPEGTDPFIGCDTWNEYVEIPEEMLTGIDPAVLSLLKDMCVYEDGIWYLPQHGLQSISISYYLNHSSKEPNMRADELGDRFYALRDIEVGEELTVDYNTYDGQGDMP